MALSNVFRFIKAEREIEHFVLHLVGGLDENLVFGPESLIQGYVRLSLNEPLSARLIKVEFQAHANKATLFSPETVVWSAPASTGQQQLPAGLHQWFFDIKLPAVNYPPSLNDDHVSSGLSIKYSLRAVLVTPEGAVRHTPIKTVRYLPLVEKAKAAAKEETKSLQLDAGGQGHGLEATATIEDGSIMPGDVVAIFLKVTNNTDSRITQAQATLIEHSVITGGPLARSMTMGQLESNEMKESHRSKHHTETMAVSIGRHETRELRIQFEMPVNVFLPSITTPLPEGKVLKISHDLMLTLPLSRPNLLRKSATLHFCIPVRVSTSHASPSATPIYDPEAGPWPQFVNVGQSQQDAGKAGGGVGGIDASPLGVGPMAHDSPASQISSVYGENGIEDSDVPEQPLEHSVVQIS
ncbi:uncharacterized protein VTP21DRAFT_1402 [Calcarisporiella thermophila]|uniref:uncharacterized protein n=1 Tax=Calcarisporiella thermophila TaxID=911321 RepID=UPI0037442105